LKFLKKDFRHALSEGGLAKRMMEKFSNKPYPAVFKF
jgi:hypothetical protein